MNIILRKEYRKEQRTAITPENAKRLVENGNRVYVELSDDRIFPIQEYINVGCKQVLPGFWNTTDLKNTLVVGLKELPDNITNIKHTMTHFQHCLKGQSSAEVSLQNIKDGMLYDIEYFTDESGRRLLSFSHNAGFVGAALAMLKWISVIKNVDFNTFYKNSYTQYELAELIKFGIDLNGKLPKVIIIGALGKCGRGAMDLFTRVGLADYVTQWDIEETKIPGPYSEILEHDILINTILLPKEAQPNPFVTWDSLKENKNLSVIVDVSCDVNSPNNVLPINNKCTTLQEPFYEVYKGVHFCSVDNLPSLVPRDASEQFSGTFTDLILEYVNGNSDTWNRCGNVFRDAVNNLKL